MLPLLYEKRRPQLRTAFVLVGVTGFEPTTSWSRTMRATICATPRKSAYMSIIKYGKFVNRFSGDGEKLFALDGVRPVF